MAKCIFKAKDNRTSQFTRTQATLPTAESITDLKKTKKLNDYLLSFTSRLLLNSQWHFISWSGTLRCASAVHHGGKKIHCQARASMEENIESKTEHIFRLDGLYATLFDRNNKSPPGTLEARRHSGLVLCPSLKPPDRPPVDSFEKKREHRELLLFLLSPPATRGRGEVGSRC